MNKISDVKVSVILPSLNVIDYIDECLHSVVNQSLYDIEIICVDAGSTDGTLDVIKKYQKKDSRIILINSQMKSYGHQMNLGVQKAAGEYIGILETDDFANLDMYRSLYDKAKEYDLDLIKSDYYRFLKRSDGSLKVFYQRICSRNTQALPYNTVLNTSEYVNALDVYMNTWSGIYKRSFLISNNILHNETPGAAYQDNGFWFQTLMFAKRAMFLDKAYYMNRRDNPNSSVYTLNEKNTFAFSKEYSFIKSVIASKTDKSQFLPWCIAYEFKNILSMRLLHQGNVFLNEYVDMLAAEYKEYFNQGLIDERLYNSQELMALKQIVHHPEEYKSVLLKLRECPRANPFPDDINEIKKVSVILIIENSLSYIADCINSIKAQDIGSIELICLKVNSNADCKNLIESYLSDNSIKGKIDYRFIDENFEKISDACNYAISIATGEFFYFIKANGKIPYTNTLSSMVNTANTTNQFVICSYNKDEKTAENILNDEKSFENELNCNSKDFISKVNDTSYYPENYNNKEKVADGCYKDDGNGGALVKDQRQNDVDPKVAPADSCLYQVKTTFVNSISKLPNLYGSLINSSFVKSAGLSFARLSFLSEEQFMANLLCCSSTLGFVDNITYSYSSENYIKNSICSNQKLQLPEVCDAICAVSMMVKQSNISAYKMISEYAVSLLSLPPIISFIVNAVGKDAVLIRSLLRDLFYSSGKENNLYSDCNAIEGFIHKSVEINNESLSYINMSCDEYIYNHIADKLREIIKIENQNKQSDCKNSNLNNKDSVNLILKHTEAESYEIKISEFLGIYKKVKKPGYKKISLFGLEIFKRIKNNHQKRVTVLGIPLFKSSTIN